MSGLFSDFPFAKEWYDSVVSNSSENVFNKFSVAVIWTNNKGKDGEILVPIDPYSMVDEINSIGYPLYKSHDPGAPLGRVIESKVLVDGEKLTVAAVIGFYSEESITSFQGYGIDIDSSAVAPKTLPALPDDAHIEFAVDPREVGDDWPRKAIEEAPLKVKNTELSHNEEGALMELIRIGIPYAAIVWNPFVTSIASEAGKDVYAAIRSWLVKLVDHLSSRRDPILAIHSSRGECQVTFILRGREVSQNHKAIESISDAAAKAANLVDSLKKQGMPGRELVYEYEKNSGLWFPSYAILDDGKIVSDNQKLIAIERLDRELSIGISL